MTTPGEGGRSARLRAVLVDVAPLRLDHDFRWLFAGQTVNGTGNQITRVALPFQVYLLTGSTLALGLLAFLQLVPILVFSLGAGSIADAVDRRRLLALTQLGLMLCSASLFLLAIQPQPNIALILVVAVIAASISSFDLPARSATIPRLVPPERLPSAIALGQLNFQAQSIIGPAIGGLILATLGIAAAYAIDVLSFTASLLALTRIRPLPPLGTVVRPSIAAIREGLAFARRRRVILSTFVIDLNAMIFGMPTALFPALALDVFKVGPAGVGFMVAAPALGALFGAIFSGAVARIRRTGISIVWCVIAWGAAITAFGLATFSFPLALLFLAAAGAADVISAVLRSTLVQTETPDQLRGRVTALHVLAVTSGPRIGDIEAAAVAALVGAQASVVSGGILCIVGAVVVARYFPELPRHLARHVAPNPAAAAA